MNKQGHIWRRIASRLIIALGAGVVWGIAVAWCAYLAMNAHGTNNVGESLVVTSDGTPVIQTTSSLQTVDQTYRTLDGDPYEPVSQLWLAPASFQAPPRPPGLVETSVPWSQRVASISDLERPPTSWYLIRDDKPLGHAYFVGYDERSRLRVGYIGRGGFRRAMPPKDEWFDMGRHHLGWSIGPIASTGYVQFGSRAYAYQIAGDNQPLSPWVVYVVEGDRLVEIDLRARSVRTIYESPGMMGVAIVTEPPAMADAGAGEKSSAQANTERSRETLDSRVALRTTDRLVILDPPVGAKREFVLPTALRDQAVVAYAIRSNELLLSWWRDGNYYGPTQLGWLQPDGTFAREESVVFAGRSQPSERVASLMAAAIAPVPIGWLAVLGVVGPLGMLQSNQTATYAEGLTKGFGPGWPALVAVLVVGVVLGWLTYRWQRKYHRPATCVWTTFVLLLGLSGIIAYWLEHRRSKLERCTSCGEIVPRDRDACAACEAEFPTPALVGTEIFA